MVHSLSFYTHFNKTRSRLPITALLIELNVLLLISPCRNVTNSTSPSSSSRDRHLNNLEQFPNSLWKWQYRNTSWIHTTTRVFIKLVKKHSFSWTPLYVSDSVEGSLQIFTVRPLRVQVIVVIVLVQFLQFFLSSVRVHHEFLALVFRHYRLSPRRPLSSFREFHYHLKKQSHRL